MVVVIFPFRVISEVVFWE